VSPNNPASTTTSPPKYAPLRLSLAGHSLPHFLHLYPHLFPSCPSLFSYKESQRFGEVEVQKLLKGKTELINFRPAVSRKQWLNCSYFMVFVCRDWLTYFKYSNLTTEEIGTI
jgi:hypothetical protein